MQLPLIRFYFRSTGTRNLNNILLTNTWVSRMRAHFHTRLPKEREHGNVVIAESPNTGRGSSPALALWWNYRRVVLSWDIWSRHGWEQPQS